MAAMNKEEDAANLPTLNLVMHVWDSACRVRSDARRLQEAAD